MNARRLTWLGGLCSLLVGVLVVPAALPAGGDTGGRPQLYLDTSGGVAAIDAESGASTFTATDARVSGDWSRLIAAAPSGPTTRVSTIDALDGTTVDVFAVDGTNAVRVVSFRGDQVASPPPPGSRRSPARAAPRSSWSRPPTAAVPGPTTCPATSSPRRSRRDGDALFVIEYLPPLDPERYQVRRLDLGTGELGEVPSPDGASQGQMPGIARTQVDGPRRSPPLHAVHECRRGRAAVLVRARARPRRAVGALRRPPARRSDATAEAMAAHRRAQRLVRVRGRRGVGSCWRELDHRLVKSTAGPDAGPPDRPWHGPRRRRRRRCTSPSTRTGSSRPCTRDRWCSGTRERLPDTVTRTEAVRPAQQRAVRVARRPRLTLDPRDAGGRAR